MNPETPAPEVQPPVPSPQDIPPSHSVLQSEPPSSVSAEPQEGEVPITQPRTAVILQPISSEADILFERQQNASVLTTPAPATVAPEDYDSLNNPISTQVNDLQLPPRPEDADSNVLVPDTEGPFQWRRILLIGLFFPILVACLVSILLKVERAIAVSINHGKSLPLKQPFYEVLMPYVFILIVGLVCAVALKRILSSTSVLSRHAKLVSLSILVMTYGLYSLAFRLYIVHVSPPWAIFTVGTQHSLFDGLLVGTIVSGLIATLVVTRAVYFFSDRLQFGSVVIILVIIVAVPYGANLLIHLTQG